MSVALERHPIILVQAVSTQAVEKTDAILGQVVMY